MEHEDKKNIEQGKEPEPFFNHKSENVKASEIINKIDYNKRGLKTKDAKFYVLTVSPSEKEIQAMGKTPAEQSEAFKEYIKNDFAKTYAENFNKGLNKDDIMYYSKIHIERKGKNENDMHAHIIVSRKATDNVRYISPATNHKNTEKGAVKGGFCRTDLYEKAEKVFDKKFSYERPYKETYQYQNTMDKGTLEQKMEAEKKAQSQQITKQVEPTKEVEKAKQQQNDISR